MHRSDETALEEQTVQVSAEQTALELQAEAEATTVRPRAGSLDAQEARNTAQSKNHEHAFLPLPLRRFPCCPAAAASAKTAQQPNSTAAAENASRACRNEGNGKKTTRIQRCGIELCIGAIVTCLSHLLVVWRHPKFLAANLS